jgi:hypothetical protein
MLIDIFNKKIRLNIELSDHCNAGCPLCARHTKGTSITKDYVGLSILNVDKFKKWFDEYIIDDISGICICGNFGDPMTCNDLPKILKYLNNNTNISIHTNGGLKSSAWWIQLAKSMEHLSDDSHVVFWLDGLEDTLHLYRRGVDYHKVVKNAKTFIEAGGRAHWGFLQFAHNEHQLDEVKRRAKEFGFAHFHTKPVSGLKQNGEVKIKDDKVKRVKRKG